MKERRFYIYVMILIAVSTAVYYPVTDYPFMKSWDDQWQILNFYTTNGLSSNNIISIFSTFYKGQYSPLNQLFYSFIYHNFGFNAFVFHFVNLFWHIGYVALTFCFIRSLLNGYDNSLIHNNMIIAFGVAILTAIHPINAEAVSWLSASKVLSSSFFYILSLLCYVCYVKKEQAFCFGGSLFFFLCSFFCKEQVVTLPFCLLLIDWFLRRNLYSRKVLIEKCPFFAITLCMLAVTFTSYQETLIDVLADNSSYPFYQRIIFCGYSVCEYLLKIFLPLNLQYIYPYPMDIGEFLPIRFYLYLLTIPALAYIIYECRNHKVFIFGILFFLIQLSPFLHIVPLPRSAITADRYLYMASIGVFLILSYYLSTIRLHSILWKCSCVIAVILLLSATGYYTQICSRKWESEKSLKYKVKQILEERKRLNNNLLIIKKS